MSTNSPISFGVLSPRNDDHATPETFEQIATTAENRGYEYFWRTDHLTFPEEFPGELYPFGNPPPLKMSRRVHESLQVLPFIAAVTEEIKLGINVCVVPYRNPVHLSKMILTLDSLSHGRFEPGFGSGWHKAEFGVLNVPYEERGSRTDEFLDLFEKVQEMGELSFDGPHHSFDKTGFYPRPTTPDGIPTWIGGFSGAAFRRTAQYGDGWSISKVTPEEVSAGCDRLRTAWNDYDRTGTPNVMISQYLDFEGDPADEPDGAFVGSVGNVIHNVERYINAGATHITVDFSKNDVDEYEEQIERFAREVVPSF